MALQSYPMLFLVTIFFVLQVDAKLLKVNNQNPVEPVDHYSKAKNLVKNHYTKLQHRQLSGTHATNYLALKY